MHSNSAENRPKSPSIRLGLFIMKNKLALTIIIFSVVAACKRKNPQTNTFKITRIASYPVGKHTLRFSYKYPYLAFITREVYNKKIDGYNFSHALTIVKLPGFDTVFVLKEVNLEWFELWKINNDTIMGFIGDGLPEKGPAWEYFKNIRFVKILPGKGILYDTILFVANGKMGGTKHMQIVSNGKKDYLMFDYDFQLHLLEISGLKYLGHTKERSLCLRMLDFKNHKMYVSVVGSRLAGHGNDLYAGNVNIDNMKVEDLLPVFEDSVRNVYGVAGFYDRNHFVFTAGDGVFAHHVYTYYKGKSKLVFSFPDNTIPFIAGGQVGKYGVFLITLGRPLSFYSYKASVGVVFKGQLIFLDSIPLPDSITFIYPPRFYSLDKDNGLFILDLFSKRWPVDSLLMIKINSR